MFEKGFISVAVLWILFSLFAMSAATLSIGRWQKNKTRLRVDETRSLLAAHAAALMALQSNFEKPELHLNFSGGQIDMERIFSNNNTAVRTRCTVRVSGFKKIIEIDWKKWGSQWRALSWRESSG